MLSDIRARFLPKFLLVARERLTKGLDLVADPSPARAGELAVVMHTLVGEAAMLGLEEVAAAARAAEQAARQWQLEAGAGAATAAARALRQVSKLIDALGPSPEAQPGEADGSPGAHEGERLRVFVADDSEVNAGVIGDALEDQGFEVKTASTRDAILNGVAAFRPHLLLSDVEMPGLTPGDLCASVRAQSGAAPTRIVLFSALPEEELATVARGAGADAFINKQAGTAAIVAFVRDEIGRRGPHGG